MLDNEPDVAPIAWTEEPVPDVYSASGFPAAVVAAMSTCEAHYNVLGTSCEEPPCIVAFVGSKQFNPNQCEGWLNTFGDAGQSDIGLDITCPDGRVVRATVVAPSSGADISVPDERRKDVGARMVRRARRWSPEWCTAEVPE
jgi:hypothetical protein